MEEKETSSTAIEAPERSLEPANSRPKEDRVLKALTFLLANEEYAIYILVIQEIARPIAVTHVPRVPAYIRGIANLRGRVIPILDLHTRLGLSAFVPGSRNRFVICHTESGEVGILADKVNDVVELKRNKLQPPPAKIAASGSGFITHIGRVGGRILIVLDTEKILQLHRGD